MIEPNDTTSSSAQEQSQRGNWARFSLRTFLVLITCACIWLAIIGNRAREQKAAVEWLQSHTSNYHVQHDGGQSSEIQSSVMVHYDFQFDAFGNVNEEGIPPGPKWLRETLGLDYLATVEAVDISDPNPTIQDFSLLANLGGLKRIFLDKTELMDASPLSGMNRLEVLSITDSPLRDLSPLSKLKRLKSVILRKTEVVDISSIRHLTNLISLDLQETRVADLSPLAYLTDLKALYLSFTPLQDLSPLANLPRLKVLMLNNTKVTDLSPLANAQSLEYLSLNVTQVRDLTPLENLKNLKLLLLFFTPLEEVEINRLEDQLPNCKIIR